MNATFFVQITVATLAVVGAMIVLWALIEFVDNRIGSKIREWMRPERSPIAADGVMAALRKERREFAPEGAYSPLPSRPYKVVRRKRPTVEPNCIPLKRQGARR